MVFKDQDQEKGRKSAWAVLREFYDNTTHKDTPDEVLEKATSVLLRTVEEHTKDLKPDEDKIIAEGGSRNEKVYDDINGYTTVKVEKIGENGGKRVIMKQRNRIFIVGYVAAPYIQTGGPLGTLDKIAGTSRSGYDSRGVNRETITSVDFVKDMDPNVEVSVRDLDSVTPYRNAGVTWENLGYYSEAAKPKQLDLGISQKAEVVRAVNAFVRDNSIVSKSEK